MAGTNKIYQFGEDCDAPYIQTDAEYEADAMRTDGWQPGVVRQEFLNKVDRQGNSMAAGLGQFIADNISGTDDIVDTLTPAEVSTLMTDAISNMSITTQPQFDDSQKPATTEFVQRALGNLSSSVVYAVNTNLTEADVGKVVLPSTGGLGFGLPLVAGMPNGARILFNGNSHGCVISRQGSDVIRNGTAGDVSAVTVLEYDVAEFTVENGVWTVSAGNEQLNTSSQFEHSKTTDGYIKLPGGVILQWGRQAIPAAITTINFPIQFPTACVNINATDYGSGCLSVAAVPVDNSSFHALARDKSQPAGGTLQICDYNWFAVGY